MTESKNTPTGQNVAYRRVSTGEQNVDRQLDGMAFDAEFGDHITGSVKRRPELDKCLKHLRAGDTLHVHSIDRLARDMLHLQELVSGLVGRGVAVKFHKENLTFNGDDDPMSQLLLNVLGSFAQFERQMLIARVREANAARRARGERVGPKPKLTDAQRQEIKRRLDGGESKRSLAAEYGVSRGTIINAMRALEAA